MFYVFCEKSLTNQMEQIHIQVGIHPSLRNKKYIPAIRGSPVLQPRDVVKVTAIMLTTFGIWLTNDDTRSATTWTVLSI